MLTYYGIKHKTKGVLGISCFPVDDSIFADISLCPGRTAWLTQDKIKAEIVRDSNVPYYDSEVERPSNPFNPNDLEIFEVELL